MLSSLIEPWENWWKSLSSPPHWHYRMDCKDHDGNPILWATNGRKIIRVISYINPSWHEEEGLVHWNDTTHDGTPELVICCQPSEENLVTAKNLVKNWMEI